MTWEKAKSLGESGATLLASGSFPCLPMAACAALQLGSGANLGISLYFVLLLSIVSVFPIDHSFEQTIASLIFKKRKNPTNEKTHHVFR